ncbi:MAG: hypothetical protein IK066_11310 [Kiritimatiellae bacterium]|nr:hypothetical protein [Kiritimatiellia bacterium]
MTRKSLCQQLMDVCTPDICQQNPFQILQLLSFVSERTLRRRREELETAHGLGEKAWNAEFEGCLAHELDDYFIPPTYELLEQVFARLDDPRQRMVDEFFGFWPVRDDDRVLQGTVSANALEKLEPEWILIRPDETPRETAISKHNLAVISLFRTLSEEQNFCREEEECFSGDGSDEAMDEFWEDTFRAWEEVLHDEEVWKIFRERAMCFGDPRISTAFIQQIQEEMPWALKQINIHLAVRCIQCPFSQDKDPSSHDFQVDLNRHLKYLKIFFPSVDDEESRKDAIWSLIIQRFDDRLHYWTMVAEKNPKYAISKGRSLLGETRGYRKFAEEYFGKEHPRYVRMCNKIAEFCNHCAIISCNHDGDWEAAVEVLQRALQIVQSPTLKNTMIDNLRAFQKDLNSWKERNICWFCKIHQMDVASSLTYKMYGDVQTETKFLSQEYRTTWHALSVIVPRCRFCAQKAIDEARLEQYPPIVEKLQAGFRKGAEPSAEECKLHYMMTQKALLWKESQSWEK